MANDLSTPLTGRKRRRGTPGRSFHFPLARVLFAIIALIGVGIVARIMLVEEPDGGRPTVETAITSTRGNNAVANTIASGPATITADAQQFPAGGSITTLPPAGSETAGTGQIPDRYGALARPQRGNGQRPHPAHVGHRRDPLCRLSSPGRCRHSGRRTAHRHHRHRPRHQRTGLARRRRPVAARNDARLRPYGRSLASTVAAARTSGHEVLLELPLEPFDYPQNDPGPHTLLTGDTTRANLEKLFWLMARFGGYMGVLNNMGARFTASAADFSPIMEELGARGIGYVDDGSSNRSVAGQLAGINKVPYARAAAVIDANPTRESILAALASLESQAMESGGAIGIVSALPISVKTVADWAAELQAKGIALVPASALMN